MTNKKSTLENYDESAMVITEADREEVVAVLKAKKSLLDKWYGVLSELQEAVEKGEDTECFFNDIQEDAGVEYAYIAGCVDEDENGISVFPDWRGQVTLYKFRDGSWG